MLAWIEHVERARRSPGAVGRTGSAHVVGRIERVAVRESRVANPAKRGIELLARHREREVLAALRTPRGELQDAVRRHTNDGERRPRRLGREAEHPGVEIEAALQIVDHENQVVEPYRHAGASSRSSAATLPRRSDDRQAAAVAPAMRASAP
jgi:hypothetical protein